MTDANGDSLAWEALATETTYDCPDFEVVHETVRLPNGTETGFDAVHEPDAVVVLAFTPDGEVVVIEEWRQAVGRTNRGLPAGTIEPTENPADAARRELEEETGYVADRIEHLTTAEPSNGLTNAVHHHFVAHGCRPTGERDLDADESIRVSTTDYDDLLAALASDDPLDGRSALCLLYYDRFEGTER